MSKTELRTDIIPPGSRNDADYSMARAFNIFPPSAEDQARTAAADAERRARLSDAWRTPAGGPANPSAALSATPEAALDAKRDRLSNAWKEGR
ncbi:hypothetical protein CR165_20535 [Pseudoroseomonas aestuarii]|uniref:Uncharacterized protein n=2 Tax=Teichococcus aestuarii TaxID=568898 RepID=A0A2U1UZ84_9PROT|nr:hypothetical protein CR165_20535 [Pseudoroseomonas aestuarii]